MRNDARWKCTKHRWQAIACAFHSGICRSNRRTGKGGYLCFQYFCISRNRKEAVQLISTRPVRACKPVRYLSLPTGEISPKPMVVYVVKEKYTQSMNEPSKLPIRVPHSPERAIR